MSTVLMTSQFSIRQKRRALETANLAIMVYPDTRILPDLLLLMALQRDAVASFNAKWDHLFSDTRNKSSAILFPYPAYENAKDAWERGVPLDQLDYQTEWGAQLLGSTRLQATTLAEMGTKKGASDKYHGFKMLIVEHHSQILDGIAHMRKSSTLQSSAAMAPEHDHRFEFGLNRGYRPHTSQPYP